MHQATRYKATRPPAPPPAVRAGYVPRLSRLRARRRSADGAFHPHAATTARKLAQSDTAAGRWDSDEDTVSIAGRACVNGGFGSNPGCELANGGNRRVSPVAPRPRE